MGWPERLASQIAEEVELCESGPWMIPSSLKLPTGYESGTVLVVGIGGSTLRLTNFTICPRTKLDQSRSEEIMSIEITPEARSGDLFAWCAKKLTPYFGKYFHSNNAVIALSWSFPLIKGRILTMGKTFTKRYVGCDLLEAFNKELPEKFHVQSVTHDGLASLIAGIHKLPSCVMALTLGTGVNITVVGPNDELVNTELSMLGRPDTTPNITLPTQEWDIEGPAAEFQPFETQVGGLWLGQMASRALGRPTTTSELWEILGSETHESRGIVEQIVTRAASLVASGLYGLCLKFETDRRFVASEAPQQVVYTGGVIFEPEFRQRLELALAELEKHFGFSLQLIPEREGSEVGAAIAALASLPH